MSDKAQRFIGHLLGWFIVGIVCMGVLWVFVSLMGKIVEVMR